jgi:16S rRNA (cytosine1402-N4)-methyltransferase
MTETRDRHVPVLLKDAIDFLNLRAGAVGADCTLGLAGHASEIVARLGPTGHFIGFDRDPEALALARARLDMLVGGMGSQAPAIELIGEAFSSLGQHVRPASCDAILADFGVSSLQLDQARRGFSFLADGPLDMRQDPRSGPAAEQVVNEASERELADLIYEYGEERRSRRIARAIVRGRPVTTTGQLARIVATAAPAMKQDRIHPATRTFQALRIYLNRELEEIKALFEAAPNVLKPSGRLVVISFHSLEDRIAKDSLRQGAQDGIWEVLTRKPVVADESEIERNPRSRSAKLRAAQRTARVSKSSPQGRRN